MTARKRVWLGFVTLGLLAVVLTGTGCALGGLLGPTPTPRPTSTPVPTPTPVPTNTPVATETPVPTPTPEPGLGIPLSSSAWQISLEAVRTAKTLEMGTFQNKTTSSPKEGYAFLILDVIIRSLDPTRAMSISAENIAILDASQTLQTAKGGGWGASSMCVGCTFTVSQEAGQSDLSVYSLVSSGGRTTMTFGHVSANSLVSFVFVVTADQLEQEWKLQFKDIPPIPFKLGDQANYRVTTDLTAQPGPLPPECRAEAIQTAQTKAGLFYQVWAEDTLTTKLALAEGDAPVDVCRDFAYDLVQTAPDGGLLLHAVARGGWASLSVVEPDGQVTSLARNAQWVDGAFVPGTGYVVFTARRLGEKGVQLYLYDRKQGASTQLYEGPWLSYRVFPDGKLLVTGSLAATGKSFEVLGTPGAGELPALKLPEGSFSGNITADGQHLLRTSYEGGTSQLIVSKIDGSEKKAIPNGTALTGARALAPDGSAVLLQAKGTAENTNRVSLYDLAAGSGEMLTPDSSSVEGSFSSDGQWVAALSTFKRDDTDKAKTQKQTLYLYSVAAGQVVKEVEGDIVNYLFSADSAYLAYTLKNEDETINLTVLKLADLSEQSLGAGLALGWGAGR